MPSKPIARTTPPPPTSDVELLDQVRIDFGDAERYWSLSRALQLPRRCNAEIIHGYQTTLFATLARVLNGYAVICLTRCIGRKGDGYRTASLLGLGERLGASPHLPEPLSEQFKKIRDKWLAHSDCVRDDKVLLCTVEDFETLLDAAKLSLHRFAAILGAPIAQPGPLSLPDPDAASFDRLLEDIHLAEELRQMLDRSEAGCEPAGDLHSSPRWRPKHQQ